MISRSSSRATHFFKKLCHRYERRFQPYPLHHSLDQELLITQTFPLLNDEKILQELDILIQPYNLTTPPPSPPLSISNDGYADFVLFP